MKRLSIILTALLTLFIFSSQSRAQQVTNAAQKAFNKKFPNAQNVHWGMEGSKVYEAEFTLNGTKMSANFDKRGHWKETEQMIANSQIPDAIMQYVNRHYKNKTPDQPAKLWRPGKTLYELEIKGIHHDLVFTPDGKLVKKRHEQEEGEENEEDGG